MNGPAAEPLLRLREVTRSVRLPSGQMLRILRGVDLELAAGERIAIVGRSGSGKSTLLNLLGLIDSPTSGQIIFAGADVTRMGEGRRARLRGASVGFIFQQFNLLEGRTALENVMMPLMYGTPGQFWRRERHAMAMLERVGLADRAQQRPNRLSGGEQQRVAVARALVRRPALILADEPTGALDVETGETVMQLLDDITAASGASLVTITHDLQIAARYPRAHLLDEGVLQNIDAHEAGRALARTAPSIGGGTAASRRADASTARAAP